MRNEKNVPRFRKRMRSVYHILVETELFVIFEKKADEPLKKFKASLFAMKIDSRT